MSDTSPKLAELVGFGDQVQTALEKVEEVAQQADTRLRQEVSQVTGFIDRAISKMQVKVDVLSAALAAAGSPGAATSSGGPVPPAGLDGHADMQFAELRRETAGVKQRLGKAKTCLGDHGNGMRLLDGLVRSLQSQPSAAAPPAQAHPGFGAEFGATFATGGAPPTAQPTAHEAHDIHSMHLVMKESSKHSHCMDLWDLHLVLPERILIPNPSEIVGMAFD